MKMSVSDAGNANPYVSETISKSMKWLLKQEATVLNADTAWQSVQKAQ